MPFVFDDGCLRREQGRTRKKRSLNYRILKSFRMLWVDRYRPTSLESLDFHREQAGQLRELVSMCQ